MYCTKIINNSEYINYIREFNAQNTWLQLMASIDRMGNLSFFQSSTFRIYPFSCFLQENN